MRVLWFTNTPANGDEYFNSSLKGTGGWLKSLDRILQEEIDLHVVFYHHQATSSFKYKKTTYHPIKRGSHYIELLKSRWFHQVLDAADQELYLRLIHKIKPDIIHIHGTENPFGCIIGKTSVQVVVSIQGNITVCRYKFFSGIEKEYCSAEIADFFNIKSLVLRDTFRGKYKKFCKMQDRELQNLKHCKYIIGRTAWDRRISRIFAPHRTYFHNDEILREQFYDTLWYPPKNKKIILHTTNGDSLYKGFETLCQTLYELIRYGLSVEWRVAGITEDDQIVKVVRKKLKSKFPTKGLILLGKLGESELVRRMLEADIYIMPSHIENSPNNLCEAMIIGMPCIATFVGGTGSLLIDGKEGVLIQDGDPWVMAGAILELLKDEKTAVKYGANARDKALKRHRTETIVSELLSIYTVIEKESRKCI